MTPPGPHSGLSVGGAAAAIPTILVVYHADRTPLRTALRDHLYALGRYGAANVLYLNVAVRSVPAWIRDLGIDMVVFHTSLLAQRWHPPTFRKLRRRLQRLRFLPSTTVAIPQDEFIHTDLLSDFLREFRVDHVLTCAAAPDWRTIYGDLVQGPVTFTRVLTGYLDPGTVARIGRLAGASGPRTVDVAYRAWRPEFWLGRHAQLKSEIADAVERGAPGHGLTTDISLRDRDTLVGDDWFRLLLRARWTIGVEGGASVVDRDGSLRQRTLDYVHEHPAASFEEVEAACFPGEDGRLGLMALSPRHLEACATRTAQVLVEGEYNGILEPATHYLPLKRDLSNLPDVLARLSDDGLRDALAERAHRDIVASRRFDYQVFADLIVGLVTARPQARRGLRERALLRWEQHLDRPSWCWVAIRQRVRPALRRALLATGLLGPAKRVRDVRRDRGS